MSPAIHACSRWRPFPVGGISRKQEALADGEGRGTGRLVLILKPMPTGHGRMEGARIPRLVRIRHCHFPRHGRLKRNFAGLILKGNSIKAAGDTRPGTVADLFEAYVEHPKTSNKSSWPDAEANLNNAADILGRKRLARDVTPDDVLVVYDNRRCEASERLFLHSLERSLNRSRASRERVSRPANIWPRRTQQRLILYPSEGRYQNPHRSWQSLPDPERQLTGAQMSKDGRPSGEIYYDPWYKARSVNEVNAHWHLQKQIRRAGHVAKVLRAQGQMTGKSRKTRKSKASLLIFPINHETQARSE
jgi:hypothetical protein